MKFGKRLKQLREKEGITQRALAGGLGMDTAYLSRVENDYYNHTPSRETIEKMVKALGLTVAESDELHVLAGKIPADVEHILFAQPKLMGTIRKKGVSRA